MIFTRTRLIYPLGIIYAAIGLTLVAKANLDPPAGRPEELVLGYVVGTLFGHTLVAAAWVALGPGKLWARSLGSLVWMLAQILAIWLLVIAHIHTSDAFPLLTTSISLLWIVALVPLWGLAFWFRSFLRAPDEECETTDSLRDHQFGLRQLLSVTAGVSLLLGVGRVAMLNHWFRLDADHEAATFVFLLLTAVVIMVPLIFAAFLRQHAVLAVLLVLLLIVGLTAAELPLHDSLVSRPGPNAWHLIWINAFTTFWVLLFVVTARLCGWRFGSRNQDAAATGLATPPPA